MWVVVKFRCQPDTYPSGVTGENDWQTSTMERMQNLDMQSDGRYCGCARQARKLDHCGAEAAQSENVIDY